MADPKSKNDRKIGKAKDEKFSKLITNESDDGWCYHWKYRDLEPKMWVKDNISFIINNIWE